MSEFNFLQLRNICSSVVYKDRNLLNPNNSKAVIKLNLEKKNCHKTEIDWSLIRICKKSSITSSKDYMLLPSKKRRWLFSINWIISAHLKKIKTKQNEMPAYSNHGISNHWSSAKMAINSIRCRDTHNSSKQKSFPHTNKTEIAWFPTQLNHGLHFKGSAKSYKPQLAVCLQTRA